MFPNYRCLKGTFIQSEEINHIKECLKRDLNTRGDIEIKYIGNEISHKFSFSDKIEKKYNFHYFQITKITLMNNKKRPFIYNGKRYSCNSVQREHDKKLNNGLPILHMIPPYRDYGRYFCIQAGKGGTMLPGLIKYQAHFLYPKQEVLCTWQMIRT